MRLHQGRKAPKWFSCPLQFWEEEQLRNYFDGGQAQYGIVRPALTAAACPVILPSVYTTSGQVDPKSKRGTRDRASYTPCLLAKTVLRLQLPAPQARPVFLPLQMPLPSLAATTSVFDSALVMVPFVNDSYRTVKGNGIPSFSSISSASVLHHILLLRLRLHLSIENTSPKDRVLYSLADWNTNIHGSTVYRIGSQLIFTQFV